ncbi:PAAR domain-containing protein [Pseudomonas sp. GCM10022186]|uniref:PAAR domain-containing protein n=1 Tax=Pseudomonas sp. GCM10022186 TaxID=3252650 RepID=UPI003621F335
MRPIVLVGHRHSCPLHGEGTVVSGASQANIDGRPVARIGDKISCGAVIQTGSPSTIIEGQPAAREGDKTSHGGTLIEGDSGWLVE